MLVYCVIICSKLNYGVTCKNFRHPSYGCGRRQHSKFYNSWVDNKTAGIGWLLGFVKRHKNLTLSNPGNRSVFSTTAFKKTKVMECFDHCKRALKCWDFIAGSVYSCTVANIAAQIGKNRLLVVATTGSLWLLNSPQSSWITETLSLKVLELTKKYTRSSKENHIILQLHNNESHCDLDSILYARSYAITLVTFPPRCCHWLQPMGVGMMRKFTSFVKLSDIIFLNPSSRSRVIRCGQPDGRTAITNLLIAFRNCAKGLI